MFIVTTTVKGAYTNFSYRKKITIDHDQVPGDLINFPIWVSLTSTDFLDSAHGGHIQPDGDDIAFYSYDNSTQYNHEIELYNGTTGTIGIWVNITYLSSSSDTNIWMYYGDADSGNQEHVNDVWDTGYAAVFHCNDVSGGLNDSTSHNYDGTENNTPVYLTASNLGYGITLDGDDGFTLPDSLGIVETEFTCFAYVKCSNAGPGVNMRIIDLLREVYAIPIYYVAADDDIEFYSRSDASSNDWAILHSNIVDTSAYHLYVSTYNESLGGDEKKAYHNSSLADQNSVTDISVGVATYKNCVGMKYDETEGWLGIIDEIRICSNARSTNYVTTNYNMFTNQSTFITFGAEISDNECSLVLDSNTFTHQGEQGNTTYSNSSGSIYETAEFNFTVSNINFSFLRVNITDVNSTNITASNVSIQFSSDNVTWGGNWSTGADGGFSILINQTQWSEANSCFGSNPFPISTNSSIWMREKVTIPTGIGNVTYSTADTGETSCTWDAGYYIT